VDGPRDFGANGRLVRVDGRVVSEALRTAPHTHEQNEALYLLQGEITIVAGEQKPRQRRVR
jgi:hypothetical protein